ncbi:MAG: chemotaxis protein CheW [Betaproteobacteria bacterium]|nr:chemotaxis protein CheW [Betaproteobacteria bacterium]
MARRTSLREFQLSVANRLRDLASRKTVSSKLGFQVGGENWIVNLIDVSEVIPVPQIMQVPLTRGWFRGVANVRGNLYSIADFAAFQGAEATAQGAERRVILLSERRIVGSGILIGRMLGLRNPEQLVREPDPADKPAWVRGVFRDPAGTLWKELDVEALTEDARFLEVGVAHTA